MTVDCARFWAHLLPVREGGEADCRGGGGGPTLGAPFVYTTGEGDV